MIIREFEIIDRRLARTRKRRLLNRLFDAVALAVFFGLIALLVKKLVGT